MNKPQQHPEITQLDEQPICGVIGRKGLPCGLKAYDHAGKHCAFGPAGEPVEFWARGTVVPSEQLHELHPAITQAEKLEVYDLITKTVGYGQPVSGPATIQLMPLLIQIPRMRREIQRLTDYSAELLKRAEAAEDRVYQLDAQSNTGGSK
jgi:hypothetical protein